LKEEGDGFLGGKEEKNKQDIRGEEDYIKEIAFV
jgi:hypothetical protein